MVSTWREATVRLQDHCFHISLIKTEETQTDLEDAVLLAERVEQRVHGVEHGDNLHRGDVAANAGEAHDVTEKNGHIWEHLRGWRLYTSAGEVSNVGKLVNFEQKLHLKLEDLRVP